MQIIVQIIIYGISLAMIYFLLSSGFSLIFGLMGVLNYSHGSLFMYGSFVCYFLTLSTGSFIIGVIGAAIAIGVLGLLIERLLIKPLKNNRLNQILLTFGLIFVLDETAKILFGTRTYLLNPPKLLQDSIRIFGELVPKYRLFIIIIIGALVFIAMILLLHKTKLGMIIRAGIDKPNMVRAVGIDVEKIFLIAFVIGCILAGVGGAVSAPFLGAYFAVGTEQIFNAIAVVVIGGIGSFKGSFYASLILGIATYSVSYFIPDLTMASTLLIMLIVIISKPSGLFVEAKHD